VLSSRLADAAIDYDGSGFVTRSAKPGIVARIFNLLGLL
jgi:flagellar L-ring protein precursor FlgH